VAINERLNGKIFYAMLNLWLSYAVNFAEKILAKNIKSNYFAPFVVPIGLT